MKETISKGDNYFMRMRLKDLREDADLSQNDISTVLSIKQNTYSQYETGQRQISLGSLIKLALFYNTSVDYILGITDDPEPYPRTKILEDAVKDKKIDRSSSS